MISTIGKVVGSILLTVFLSSAIFAGTGAMITDIANVRSAMGGIFEEALKNEASQPNLETSRTELIRDCGTSETVQRDYAGIGPVNVSCSEIKSRPAGDLPQIFAGAYVDAVYYRSYTCDFLTCFRQATGTQKLYALTSQNAHSYFITLLWLFAALALVGLIIIIASVRHAFTILKVVGVNLIISGLPGFFIAGLKALLPLQGASASAFSFVDAIFSFLSTTYLGIFGIGIILAVAGFVLAAKWPPVKKKR